MDMAMNEIARMIFIYQPAEAFESLMAGIFRIMNVSWRSMCNHYINTTPPPECRTQSTDDGAHLPLGVLMGTAIVPMRSFQPQDFYSFESHQAAVQVIAAFRRFIIIPNIMVAPYIVKGGFQKMSQSRKVFRRKVAAGNNEIDTFKQVRLDPPIQHGLNNIGD